MPAKLTRKRTVTNQYKLRGGGSYQDYLKDAAKRFPEEKKMYEEYITKN